MKNRIFSRRFWMIASMVLLVHVATVPAQDRPPSTTSPEAAETATPLQTKPVHLSDGVSDVLTLVREHVGDDIVVGFIESSRKPYNLTAKEILYLRQEKVSDRVLAAMMNQRKKVAPSPALTASQAPTPAPPQPANTDTSSTAPSTSVQLETPSVQAPTVYVPTAPAYVSPGYANYGYPYYGYPYYWGYVPPVSLSFGFGYGYYGHGHGYYGGGGYHGGGGGYHGGGGGSHGGGHH
jgi:uncharacterized membrane protein YgcG